MILACGSKTIETEKVPTSDGTTVTTEEATGTANKTTTTNATSTVSTSDLTGTSTTNTSTSATIVKPVEGTVETEVQIDDTTNTGKADE